MGFPVQELVYVPVPAYFLTGGVESVDQQAAVCIRERRSFVSVREEALCLCDSFREVRCIDLDASHGGVQAIQGIRILSR